MISARSKPAFRGCASLVFPLAENETLPAQRRLCRMGALRPELRRSFGFVRTVLLILGITQAASAEVRLGGLFLHEPIWVGQFMAFVMAIQEINNSTDLLPGNALR